MTQQTNVCTGCGQAFKTGDAMGMRSDGIWVHVGCEQRQVTMSFPVPPDLEALADGDELAAALRMQLASCPYCHGTGFHPRQMLRTEWDGKTETRALAESCEPCATNLTLLNHREAAKAAKEATCTDTGNSEAT